MRALGWPAVALVLMMALVPPVCATLRQRHLVLKKYTTLTARITPGLGTRFIFPFVLDRTGRHVPFTLDLTNPEVFAAHRDSGRNFFIVTARPGTAGRPRYGTLYVTVAGYELTIELCTSARRAADASDVIFSLGSKARAGLIRRAVARRTRALQGRYRQQVARLDREVAARTRARIGVLALDRPRRRRIEQETRARLPGGDRVVLYVRESLSFGPYTVFVFRLRNESAVHRLRVENAELFQIDAGSGRAQPLPSAPSLPRRIAPGGQGRGVLTITHARLDARDRLRLEVLTDRVALQAQW
ncbi:MAG: hypothetical protein ACYDHM_06860 [Acidiferrobacterales bacterium]